MTAQMEPMAQDQIRRRIEELGGWFQNMEIHGVKTAPHHPLGDYPSVKWRRFANAIPQDLSGKTVLDIGCNGGFYSIEMKKRGAARVLGIDTDARYLAQADFASRALGVEIEWRRLSVYDVAQLSEKFDIVIFMGVLYHLRHPLLALDLIREHAAKDMLIFQSMQRGSSVVPALKEDYGFNEVEIFERSDFPRMFYIENRYAGDPTNWWIPNRACVEAMLRSAGFTILDRPEDETLICRVDSKGNGL